jgi:hypothetical protein
VICEPDGFSPSPQRAERHVEKGGWHGYREGIFRMCMDEEGKIVRVAEEQAESGFF